MAAMPAPPPPPVSVVPVVADPQATLKRILLVKLSALGDIVHALPLAEGLRAALPHAHLAWAVRGKFAPLLAGCPHLDAMLPLEGRGARDIAAFGQRLRRERFDAVLDAQGLLVSGLLARLSNAPLRIGMDRNREGNAWFLTHPVVPGRRERRAHIVNVLLDFLPALGLPRPAHVSPQTYLADGEAAAATALLAQATSGNDEAPRAGLIIGASTPDKAWPAERWAQLTRLVWARGLRPVLLGGPGEADLAAFVLQNGAPETASLVGQTPLPVLASVLARCQVVVGGDSGPTHLAVGVGTPVVGLYGVTDPALTGPAWGSAPAVVLDFAEADAPSEKRRARHNTVPDALARIPAEDVAEAVVDVLNRTPAAQT